ncbi:MAG: hypothetical protein QOE99_573 [Actinomycetota bacterium]|jgi:hypothetical protein|nr:hypothetical protein [Actinomycetota bacterium]
MDVTRLFLQMSPSGLQKVARRNCASSLVELAVTHAGGVGAQVTPAMLDPRRKARTGSGR